MNRDRDQPEPGQTAPDERGDEERAGRDLAAALSESDRMLVVIREGLYDGDWEAMLGDLRARLAGQPYIYKLVNRIQDDITAIERLADLEREHGIDLADYVDEGGEP